MDMFDTVEHPTSCASCGARFSIVHGIACKRGGLVIQHHVEIKFELQDLAARSLIPYVVRNEPQSTQVAAQMLKRLKECHHQQKNEVIE